MAVDTEIERQCRENLRKLASDRRWYRRVGAILFWAAIAFMIVDLRTGFPTPARGHFMLECMAAIVIGVLLYLRSYRLPVKEALQIARMKCGVINAGILAAELNGDPDDALATLAKMEKNGHATSVLEGQSRVWILHDLIASVLIPAMNVVRENRTHEQITIPDLANALSLDLDQAKAVLEELRKRGLAKSYPLLDTIVYDVPQTPDTLKENE